MQRAQFELIAQIIRETESATLRNAMAQRFADGLRHTNARFDREKFLIACNFKRES